MKNTAKASFSLEKGRVPNIPAFFVLQVSTSNHQPLNQPASEYKQVKVSSLT
jgi:hypothetical protein